MPCLPRRRGRNGKYPHTPGVDAATWYPKPESGLKPGDQVLVTGYGLGMNGGGYGEYIRVPAAWVVRLPENLSLRGEHDLRYGQFTAACPV